MTRNLPLRRVSDVNCPICQHECLEAQKFCTECGAPVGALIAADRSSSFAPPPPGSMIAEQLPPVVAAASADVSATVHDFDTNLTLGSSHGMPAPAPSMRDTSEIRIVEQTTPAQLDTSWPAQPEVRVDTYMPSPATNAVPTAVAYDDVDDSPRMGAALATLAGIAGIGAILGSALKQMTIRSDAPIPDFLGGYKLNDFRGTNLQVAFVAAGLALLVGAFLAASGKRFGRGLLAGAGLALVPAVVCVLGFMNSIRDQADDAATSAAVGGGGGTYFDYAPEIGFYILLGSALLGLFAFFASLGRSTGEGRYGLNSALCALGAIASVAAGVGQLIPENGASFGDNFGDELGNKAFIYGRLAMAVMVAACGVIGFLRKSRWGVGLALGGLALYAWQWVSSLAGLGDVPAPPAFLNPGAAEFKPHMVTSVGVIAMVVVGLLALATARPRRADLA